ncbi:MAG TPA: anhydro-N-acetylmuramic acid kinase, partial [Bacteroidia bacterium]|nr:anhydro-N-acetylmuramic acid kinase [Bacteroidia bacterium]
ATKLPGFELTGLNVEYGHYLGGIINQFLSGGNDKTDFISSHGHTIFHQPEQRFTLQIGDGASLAAETGLTVVCDFRSGDVALGGQGAPLVPIGDRILFSEYDYCVNIGGIANISFEENNQRIAFDICPANQLLNKLCEGHNPDFDKDGLSARAGNISTELLNRLNEFSYYNSRTAGPKSLGNEHIAECFFPLLSSSAVSQEDKLRTCTEHIVEKISETINHGNSSVQKVLLTGGGAFNKFLVEVLKEKTHHEIILPSEEIIKFKEALVFAFLGVLRMRNEINILKSVTGASRDSVGGATFTP